MYLVNKNVSDLQFNIHQCLNQILCALENDRDPVILEYCQKVPQTSIDIHDYTVLRNCIAISRLLTSIHLNMIVKYNTMQTIYNSLCEFMLFALH